MIFKQYRFGCILFALVNSGMISDEVFDNLIKRGESPRNFPDKIEKIKFEIKLMTIWAIISGYYPTKFKETFYSIYSRFKKLLAMRKDVPEKDFQRMCEKYDAHCLRLEKAFAEHDNKTLLDGSWDRGKRLKLKVLPFDKNILEGNDIVCVKLQVPHWVVFNKFVDDKNIEVLDSSAKNGDTEIYNISDCCSMIKNKKIYLSPTILDLLDNDNYLDIMDLKRVEFSKKMQLLLSRLNDINFSVSEYNRAVDTANNFLNRLNKEHFKIERFDNFD